MAEDAAIPPLPKRQADPAAGDAKKLKQGKTDLKKMMEDFKAEYDENADEQAILDLVAKFKDEYNGKDDFELTHIVSHLSRHPPAVIINAGDSALQSWFIDCAELNFPERDQSLDLDQERLVKGYQINQITSLRIHYQRDMCGPLFTSKDYVLKLHCAYCGQWRDHWTKDCPRKSEFKGKAKQAVLAELAKAKSESQA